MERELIKGLKAFPLILTFEGLKKHNNTVFDPVFDPVPSLFQITRVTSIPGRRVTVEITRDNSFGIPKSKDRRISKGVVIKNHVQKFQRDMKIIFLSSLEPSQE